MKVMLFLLAALSTISHSYTDSINNDDQSQEIVAARCYSKCLQIFIRFKSTFTDKTSKPTHGSVNNSIFVNDVNSQTTFVDEVAIQLSVTEQTLRECLEDKQSRCSRQCFKSCASFTDCICQHTDIGCLLSCYFRKEISKESGSDECPSSVTVEESTLKASLSKCPKTCKGKSDCNRHQQCCTTDSCGPICLQIEDIKPNLPTYTPRPTHTNTHLNIEFDWSETFSKYLINDAPLVFILQTRTCLCKQIIDKFMTPWQTLVMTHRLGAKLNALDNGTIYQFRLAAVSPKGTNGFGSVSQNLPLVISKPMPPFPVENLREYKWRITDENLFVVEVKWDEPKPSPWRSYEYLFSWMVDHGVVQPEGEPMSSLTQYNKVLPGTIYYTTIDNLKSSTTYKLQIVTRAEWPGNGDILSESRTMYITTPATISPESYMENFKLKSKFKDCSCPEQKLDNGNVRISVPVLVKGDLRVTIYMDQYSDYNVKIQPEVCIDYSSEIDSLIQSGSFKLYKQTSEIIIGKLQFHCRYSVHITNAINTSVNITYNLCFCTPPCYKAHLGKKCPTENVDISSLHSPKNVKFSLFNYDTMTYKLSWDATGNNYRKKPTQPAPDFVRYRILWAPRKFEPVPIDHYNDIIGFDPIFDWDRSDVRIVPSNITRLLLHNLTKDQLYIVRIQSLAVSESGQLLESHPAAIFLPTHGFSDIYYHNSHKRMASNLILVILALKFCHYIVNMLS